MACLPVVGGDSGNWGTILNGFLEVSLNQDGTIQPTALTAAGGVTSVNTITPNASGNVTLTAANIGAYSKPSGGIPSTDLSSSVQADLTAAGTAVQLGETSAAPLPLPSSPSCGGQRLMRPAPPPTRSSPTSAVNGSRPPSPLARSTTPPPAHRASSICPATSAAPPLM